MKAFQFRMCRRIKMSLFLMKGVILLRVCLLTRKELILNLQTARIMKTFQLKLCRMTILREFDYEELENNHKNFNEIREEESISPFETGTINEFKKWLARERFMKGKRYYDMWQRSK